MSLALRLWQDDDDLHAELESIMFQHLALVKEFSTASRERKQQILQEVKELRTKCDQLLK